ncbi:MAG: hypothetical protein J1F03_06325 [Oscillospiraceae bacterium]|nr:hypothetical protein [Oscillospiraceae bacterium]
MEKSFFGKYFLHKFSSLRGFLAASSVLAIAGIPTLMTMIEIYVGQIVKYAEDGSIFVEESNESAAMIMSAGVYCMLWMLVALAASAALALVVPIVSFNYYNNRALTDTIGSLPLTYSQRFWGDFLAGFTVSVAPFLVCIPYIFIVSENVIPSGVQQFEAYLPLPGFIEKYTFLFAVILASAYTFSTLIVSCCGKAGSAVFYSLVGMMLIPGTAAFYTAFVSSGAVGVPAETAFFESIGVIVPFGLVPDVYVFWFKLGNSLFNEFESLMNLRPVEYVIMLLLTAVYAAAAYYLGKYRKTERIGRDFVYESIYSVMSVIFITAIFGFVFWADSTSVTHIMLVIGVGVGLLVYLGLELSHTRSFKKLPKAMIKYAVICAVCFGFFGITKLTDSFGISDIVPSADEILRVEINGKYFFSYDKQGVVYDDRSAIESIVSEHKKLLSDKSRLATGQEISITYKLKNGLEIHRQYYDQFHFSEGGEEDTVKTMSDAILALPSSDSNAYGVLGSEDYSDLSFFGDYYIVTELDPTEAGVYSLPQHFLFRINPSKTEEFKQILLNDLKSHYFGSYYMYGGGHVGSVVASYTRNGIKYEEAYTIIEDYEETFAFILNPENCTASAAAAEDAEVRTYTAYISLDEEFIRFDFSSDSEPAKELLSLLTDAGGGELSEDIRIFDERGFFSSVRKSDEKRAVELILQLANEILSE